MIAVVRPSADDTARALAAEGCEVVVCREAERGMGASRAWCVRAVGDGGGCLDALRDVPFVRPSASGAGGGALGAGARLAVPYFRARGGQRGGIAARLRAELEAVGGDEGARSVLERHAGQLVKIPCGDPGVIRDIDAPGDLAPPLAV